MAQPGHDQRQQRGHLEDRKQVLHEGPFPDATNVDGGQDGDHPAGHQLGRVEFDMEQAVGNAGLCGQRQQFAQRNPCQHVGLSQAGDQHTEVLGKGNRHGSVEAVLDDQELRPAEEKGPEVAIGFAEKDVLPTGVRVHGGQFAQEIAPNIVNNPPKAQRPMSNPGVSTHWAMIDSPMKMPEPIIEPTTMVVASNNRRWRCS